MPFEILKQCIYLTMLSHLLFVVLLTLQALTTGRPWQAMTTPLLRSRIVPEQSLKSLKVILFISLASEQW